MPRPKKETLYSNKNNVDINNLINNNNLSSSNTIDLNRQNQQIGGKNIKKSSSKKKDYDESNEDLSISSGGGDDDDDDDENEIEVDDNDEINENDNDINNNDVNDNNDELEANASDDDIKGAEEQEGSEAGDEESDKGSEKGSDDEKDIDEDAIKKNCYSKYAAEADEVDLEELFANDDFKLTKTARLSKPVLFKYEKVRLLSTRAKQLANGAKPMIKNTENLSSKEIALLELKNKLIPMIIERPIPNSGVERWKLSELEIIDYN
jgi:DNA-directed RNA polymerase subunit K/omega